MTISEIERPTASLESAIAVEVKVWMVRKGYKQIDLGTLLEITQAAISRRLKGQTPFTMRELMTIAAEFGLSLNELLGEDVADTKNPRHLLGTGDQSVAAPGLDPGTSRL